MRYNEHLNAQEPHVTGYKQGFELSWDKEQVKKLLDSSTHPCEQFYIGPTGNNANDPVADKRYTINDLQDFLEGRFNDLIDLGRLCLSYPEPSVYLVDSARKRKRENRESSLGMRNDSPGIV